MRKTAWLVSAALITVATPGFAQDTQSATSVTESASAPGEETTNAGDIVVTATRRAEALSDVPIAVSAVSAESLQNSGANDIRQLNQLAPSLLVSSTGSEANGSARIRGIGTVGDNPGLESSVAVFIDGVYRSRSGIGLSELGEIDRIEVLRGPQGTLFGRNASAGLIHIISKRPSFDFSANAEATYGNYDYIRLAGGITGPVTDSIALRLDGVYVKRDGFLRVVTPTGPTGERVNDRDRYFIRGQALFEPNDDFSIRLIGDYTKRQESCCGAVYRSTFETFDPTANTPANPNVEGDFAIRQPSATSASGNRVVDILASLGNFIPTPGNRFSRQIAPTPGRTYAGETEDYGASGEFNWDLGAATLTSITAYRYYKSGQGGDIDYSTPDILFRNNDGTSFRRFKTFTQELRLQGSLFEDRLDWLVGAYYANEKLATRDNLQFGADYGQFLACRLVSAISASPTLRDPDRDTDGCLSAAGMGTILASFPGANAAGGTDGAQLVGALQRLSGVRNVGFQTSNFNQKSENYAFFTHNIIHVTNTLDVTLGLRYTNETKDLRANFNNTNTFCPANQAAAGPAIAGSGNATVRALIDGSVLFSCLFNSSSQLNALLLDDQRKEDEFTGTAVVSWKPFDDLLAYASYSKGYKAGGFNLDSSALGPPTAPATAAQVANLQFDAEKVDAYEIGFKYNGRKFNLNVAAFRQEFKSFQLNTFNGLFFLVQTVNGCGNLVGGPGADSDASGATGTCARGDIEPGVIAQGVELEASVYPGENVAVTGGFTYARTKYENDLVGNNTGLAPLATELVLLPGQRLSNAPEFVVTASFAWTPPIGDGGLSGLFYVDTRLSSDYNTGSDLFPEKEEDGFALVNARIGIRGPDQRWSVEVFAQNLLNDDYDQVSFNSPLQSQAQGSRAQVQRFGGTANQLFSSFLAEPRTYGITLRSRF